MRIHAVIYFNVSLSCYAVCSVASCHVYVVCLYIEMFFIIISKVLICLIYWHRYTYRCHLFITHTHIYTYTYLQKKELMMIWYTVSYRHRQLVAVAINSLAVAVEKFRLRLTRKPPNVNKALTICNTCNVSSDRRCQDYKCKIYNLKKINE